MKWTFLIKKEVIEVNSTEKRTDALEELGRAIGFSGTRKHILNEIYKLKPITLKIEKQKASKKGG